MIKNIIFDIGNVITTEVQAKCLKHLNTQEQNTLLTQYNKLPKEISLILSSLPSCFFS